VDCGCGTGLAAEALRAAGFTGACTGVGARGGRPTDGRWRRAARGGSSQQQRRQQQRRQQQRQQ
jgi:hypothetical protein